MRRVHAAPYAFYRNVAPTVSRTPHSDNASGVRLDEIVRSRIGALTLGGLDYAADPTSDSYGCDRCT